MRFGRSVPGGSGAFAVAVVLPVYSSASARGKMTMFST